MRIGDLYRTPASEPGLLIGRVKADATGRDTPITVIVDQFDTRYEWGPCPWTPRGTDWPRAGDDALIARVAETTWVIAWWPRAGSTRTP